MRTLLAVITVLLVALALAPAAAFAAPVEPASAAAFRDSVGVNTHVNYFDTAYARWPEIVQKLDELGVDHLRDGAYNPAGWTAWNERYRGAVLLAASRGKRFTFVMGAPGWRAGSLPELLDVVAGPLRPATEALEGPNEFDLESGLLDWASPLRSYVADLRAGASADPRLAGLPIVGPSLVRRSSRDALGDVAAHADHGNLHAYAGGRPPSQAKLADEWWLAQKVTGTLPPWVTEAGFHDAHNATTGQPAVPEDVAAAYTLRTLLEHFRFGVPRTYLYELVDQKPDPAGTDPEQHFGLLRNDLSEKPAFSALRNLLAVLGRPAAPGELEPVDITLDGDLDGLAALLLQEPGGRYRLVVWNTASLWDTQQRVRTPVPARAVGITI
ncbi:MAG: hypothetical protein M3320_03400, partial [Actinomycetota bacterium]|nr:hypothetical protein [Actinomycetota bacterium]